MKELTNISRERKLKKDVKQAKAKKTTTYDEAIDKVVQKCTYKYAKIKEDRISSQGYISHLVGSLKKQSLKGRIQSFSKLEEIQENFDCDTAYDSEHIDEEYSEEHDEGFMIRFDDLIEKNGFI